MVTPRATVIRRLLGALDAAPSRIPVLLGGCGSGRTTLLRQLHERLGRMSAQFVDVERTATTPERFHHAIGDASPFPGLEAAPLGARPAFDATLAFLTQARTPNGEAATFLLDEFLELRTFESFPGLRRVLHDLLDGLAGSGNRFVLTSRYTARALRLMRDRTSRFEVIHVPPMTVEDTFDLLGPAHVGQVGHDGHDDDLLARTVQALGEGRPSYVRAIADELESMRANGGGDALSALAAQISPGGRLAGLCEFCYELRLHRARGYGALKAILEILGEEEGLTLTEISQRLHRTPGSTKDYLSWLEDVDLVVSRQKRYSFADPLLRVWVRLHCRATIPTDDDVAREVHHFALPRVPQGEPALAMVSAGAPDEDKKAWGIIEID
ncbi:MAG: winged helix-turn-helix transcriptional regulator [Vicinamibacterales bacterium]